MKLKELKNKIKDNEIMLAKAIQDDELQENIESNDKNIIMKERRFRNFQRLVLYIFIILLLIYLMFTFVLGITTAPNEDMRPAFHGGDMVIYDRMRTSPGINDVVVFEEKNNLYIGRVIAKGGDKVEILEKGGIKINNASFTENYIYEKTLPLTTVKYPLALQNNEYFVLADSRTNGLDSRYFGAISKSDIKGVVSWNIRRRGF